MSKQTKPTQFLPKTFSSEYGQISDVVSYLDQDVIQPMLDDFSRLVKGETSLVLVPQTAAAIQKIVQLANKLNDLLTVRALGLSQGGQAVPNNSIVLSTSALKEVTQINVDHQSVTCEPGVTWYELLRATAEFGLIPYVMPLNLNLTVGGTISVGGIGSSSHRYGISASHVTKLTMVSGEGEMISCSHQNQSDAFHAVLAGLGRCGIITNLTLKLRPFKKNTRTFYFLYDNHDYWLEDQKRLSEYCDHIEAFCSASLQGFRNTSNGRQPFVHWFYTLQVSFEYDSDESPPTEVAMKDLRYYKKIYEEDNETVAFAGRFQPRFDLMQHTGAWQLFHPWFESVLSLDALSGNLPNLLEKLPVCLGDGHRVFLIAQHQIPSNFIMPTAALNAGFAVLPMGIPHQTKEQALTALRLLEQRCVELGGKRALSGWLDNRQPPDWQTHYGDYYSQWIAMKKQFDPNHILSSKLFG